MRVYPIGPNKFKSIDDGLIYTMRLDGYAEPVDRQEYDRYYGAITIEHILEDMGENWVIE